MTRSSLLGVALAALLVTSPVVHAGTLQGVTFPDAATVGGKPVVLNGMGVRVAYVFVKVYVAGLYLTTKTSDGPTAIQTDTPKRMILQFLREVTHDEMVDAMNEGFAHTASAALAPQVAQFSAFFTEPLPEGSQTTFDYVPGTGTTVTISGKQRGVIPGADFMQALWGIWLGAKPADSSLKSGLLGGGS